MHFGDAIKILKYYYFFLNAPYNFRSSHVKYKLYTGKKRDVTKPKKIFHVKLLKKDSSFIFQVQNTQNLLILL